MTTMRIAGLVGKASTVSFLHPGALASCSGHGAKVTPQTLRTCVDRWNQANMIGWGPGPANVAFRHPAAKEHSTIELPSRRQCIVATPAGGGTWTCGLSDTGADGCPPLHEPTGPPLRALGKNAMIDRRGVLKPDAPLKGTHSTPPLAWARYPLVDGYIQPWTAGGR